MNVRLNLLSLGLACLGCVLAAPVWAVSFQCPAALQETPSVKAPGSPWLVVAPSVVGDRPPLNRITRRRPSMSELGSCLWPRKVSGSLAWARSGG
jgi:hypothetical protein